MHVPATARDDLYDPYRCRCRPRALSLFLVRQFAQPPGSAGCGPTKVRMYQVDTARRCSVLSHKPRASAASGCERVNRECANKRWSHNSGRLVCTHAKGVQGSTSALGAHFTPWYETLAGAWSTKYGTGGHCPRIPHE